MKLLIDIPEHVYEHAKEGSEDSRDEGEAMRAIANGSQQESCGDAISRQAVLEGLRTCYDTETKEYSDGSQWINYEDAVAEMENLPSVTPQPKMGLWKIHRDSTGRKYGECSECMMRQSVGSLNYCPNCGAKMEVEE